jgi:hypothetical protein
VVYFFCLKMKNFTLPIAVLLSVCWGLAACKKSSQSSSSPESPAVVVSTAGTSRLFPERRAQLEREREEDLAAERRDHAELVKPARPGFKPQSDTAKLAMRLVVERTRIKMGEPIRYRLEMQNVARDSVTFIDSPHSFVKDGSLSDTYFKAYLTDSRGRKQELESPIGGLAQVYEFKLPNERYLTEQQKTEAIAELNRQADRQRELMVTLMPGEVLVTRSDPPKSAFRPLDADLRHLKPGRYSLRFVYAREKLYGSDDVDLQIILEMRSNPVSLEITP